MIAVLIVNFCRSNDTIECLDSLFRIADPPFHIFLADNGSDNDDATRLRDYANHYRERITFIAFPENYGFTGAHNRLFEQLICEDGRYEFILLLNNDTIVAPDFLSQMLKRIDRTQHIEMVAARMMKYDDRIQVDNLGITFYKCGLASNRKSPEDPLLGPCGGCGLYTTDLFRKIYQPAGEYFDEQFFCYAEDTDLAWRAVLLGYRSAYAESAVVYHKGSIASGGPNSDFVLYHGIRNSLFVLVKDLPIRFLLRNLPWILALHIAILLRYMVKGKLPVVIHLYRDFLRGSLTMWRKRRLIQQQRQISSREIKKKISPLFYERKYISGALRDLYTFH